MIELVPHLPQMMTPRVFVSQLQNLHLQFAKALVLEARELFFDFLDLFGAARAADHGFEEDTDKLGHL